MMDGAGGWEGEGEEGGEGRGTEDLNGRKGSLPNNAFLLNKRVVGYKCVVEYKRVIGYKRVSDKKAQCPVIAVQSLSLPFPSSPLPPPYPETAMGKAKSNSSTNVNRKAEKGGMRSKATIQRLNMYNNKPVRNREGKIVGGSYLLSTTAGGEKIVAGKQGRIAPDRRWFGNTRVISQTELDDFREKVTAAKSDPYSILLRRKKIPMALLKDAADAEKAKEGNLGVAATAETFKSVFGSKATRRKPKLAITNLEELVEAAATSQSKLPEGREGEEDGQEDKSKSIKDDLFAKGQSKRIWGELYKVLDCSDVVLQVVDARNVPGTRCYHVEKHVRNNASHKQLVTIINKCDLVPAWCTRKWVQILSQDFPTLAFHAASNNKAFGKGALITLLRQFGKLHSVSHFYGLFYKYLAHIVI
jgi:nuclear GTP-binding protein